MAVASGRRVLAGSEGLAGDELVPHDLHELLCSRVGDVHDKQWRSNAGDERWRRPWRGRGRCSTVGRLEFSPVVMATRRSAS
jgi:hypothetical protein